MRVLFGFVLLAFAALQSGEASAAILIKIDKSTQTMTVSRDGETLYRWPVSTGRPSFATPSGNYTAFRMEAEHFSKEWDDAPMPHSIFFTQSGIAVHGTYETKNLGVPVSHGCVRLSRANAATLFNLVKQDGLLTTKVVLTGSEQVALAARAAQKKQLAAANDDTTGTVARTRVPAPVAMPSTPVAAPGTDGYGGRYSYRDEAYAPPVYGNRYGTRRALETDETVYGARPGEMRPRSLFIPPNGYDEGWN